MLLVFTRQGKADVMLECCLLDSYTGLRVHSKSKVKVLKRGRLPNLSHAHRNPPPTHLLQEE